MTHVLQNDKAHHHLYQAIVLSQLSPVTIADRNIGPRILDLESTFLFSLSNYQKVILFER